MSDFLEALKRGVATAELAINNHKEIDAILLEASEQIQEFTAGRVSVYVALANRPAKLEDLPERKSAEAISENYFLASPSNAKEYVSLFTVRRHKEGYPSSVVYGAQEVQCYESEGLKAAISDALSSPEVGAKIIALT